MANTEIEIKLSKKLAEALNEVTEQIKLLNLISAEAIVHLRKFSQEMKNVPWYVRIIIFLRSTK